MVITLRPEQDGRQFADEIFKHSFLKDNISSFIEMSLKCVPVDLDDTTGSDNGLAPNRRQAITWTSGDTDPWCYMTSPGHNELTTMTGDLTENVFMLLTNVFDRRCQHFTGIYF